MDVAISGGAEDRVTDTVHRITGRPARTFSTFVAQELRAVVEARLQEVEVEVVEQDVVQRR
jgi:hypothetical protein